MMLLLLLLLAAAPSNPSPARTADLQKLRSEIARLRDRLEVVRQQAKSAQQELEEVDLELGIRTNELAIAQEMAARLDAERQSIQQQIDALTPRIAKQKKDLGKRLVSLYELGGLSYVRMLLSVSDRNDPLEAISMLSYLVTRDAHLVTRFQTTQQQLAARHADLADRQVRLAQMQQIVVQRRAEVLASKQEKERLLASLRTEESGSSKQLAELEEKAKRLERLLSLLSKQQLLTAAVDIRTVAGALPWPVNGKVTEHFGLQRNPKFSTVTHNNGLKIAAAPGDPVHAVFQGTVLFSQWFKGYGNLIILDHGNRVFSLYGNLKGPSVAVGDRVTAGQPIAGVGESEDAQSGYLYFEIRQDNKPEDPQKWLR